MKAYLANAAETKKIIEKYGFAFRKQFGQNFLIDESVPEAIVRTADLSKDDTVLEIGPGIGTMTQYLAEAAGSVIAVEIDKALIPILADTLAGFDNVQVLQGDILKTDLAGLIAEHGGGPIKVVANLPYYITTPILMKLLAGGEAISLMAVMVQEEVARRIVSGPGNKDYGSLSISVRYYADPEIICRVAPSSFLPQPKVASSVLRLKKRAVPAVRPRMASPETAVSAAGHLPEASLLPLSIPRQPKSPKQRTWRIRRILPIPRTNAR